MILTQTYKFAKFGPKTEMCLHFYETWHLEEIEHANMYIALGIDDLDPKL